jgi:hypothetical protein
VRVSVSDGAGRSTTGGGITGGVGCGGDEGVAARGACGRCAGNASGGVARAIVPGALDSHHWLRCTAQPTPNPATTPPTTATRASTARRLRR